MATYVGAALDEIGREMRKKRSRPSVYEGWTEGQPRDCYVCGKPVRISRDNCGFRTSEPRLTWHFECAKGAPRP
jgi:hypothetical protein